MANEERRRIIAILEEVRDAADRGERVVYLAADRPRLQVAFELCKAGFIEGHPPVRDSQGKAFQCGALGLTALGREHLGELKAKEDAERLTRRALPFLRAVGMTALGVGGTLLSQWLWALLKRGGTP